MESIASFTARALVYLRGATFWPLCPIDIQIGGTDCSGNLLASARMGSLMLFTDGYPSGQDSDGFDFGFGSARIRAEQVEDAEQVADIIAAAGHTVTVRRVRA